MDFFDLLIRVGGWALPVFVFLTMFNVGLTQKPSDIAEYYGKWKFMLRMLLANFILAPLVMILLVRVFKLPQDFATGLTIFSLTAGAPFLIKLTQFSEHDVALGASLMLLLVAFTVITLPFSLPLLMPDVNVETGAIAMNLLKSLVWPVILGMLASWLLPSLTDTIQPWVAKLGGIAMNIVLITNVGGYIPDILNAWQSYALALLAGLLFIVAALGLGWWLGGKSERDDLQDVGALGTAQRNTAASMLVAAGNFSGAPNVLVIITVVNAIGIYLLRFVAGKLSQDNKITVDEHRPHVQRGP